MAKLSVIFFLIAISFFGCTIVNQPKKSDGEQTQLQVRQFQTREFDTNDIKLVMKALLNVLQDDDFVIKNAVVDLGLISASKEIDLASGGRSSNNDFWADFFKAIFSDKKSQRNDPTVYNKLKVVEATINVTEYGKRTKVRANFQAKILDNRGNPVEVYTVDDEKFYRDFFAKVDKGIFLQKQGL
ncbi:MAG: hypothetical protein N2319_05675 [Candidatus Kapabacteria bacterium]|nr:hypothetical protein [Candidatus Kapabacteria bacterium]